MSNSSSPRPTAGGAAGRMIGKVKSVVGSLFGNDTLEREGNLQQAQADAADEAERRRSTAEFQRGALGLEAERVDLELERERLRTEVEADRRKARVEQDEARMERHVDVEAAEREAAIVHEAEMKQRAAAATERAALHRRDVDAQEAARLERAARVTENVADAIDPEVDDGSS